MPLIAKDRGGSDFKKAPAGVHRALCNMVVDCGVQPGGAMYNRPRHQAYIRFELPAERIEWEKDGKKHEGPMNIGKFYTVSLSEKATLRRDLENWRGKPFTADELKAFDLFKLLGAACQIMVMHKTSGKNVYANITGIMGYPKDVPKPIAAGKLIKYSPDEPAMFEELPNWLKERVTGAQSAPPETVTPGTGDEEEFSDDIPF